MLYVLADRRDRDLFVVDAENGVRVFTRDVRRARSFPNTEAARTWACTHLLAVEFEAAVLLNARPILKKNPAQAGRPGGVNSSEKPSHETLHRIESP